MRSENWLDFPSGISGTYLAASFARGGRLRHELYIDSGDDARNLEVLHALDAEREGLESVYGRSLTFEELPDRRASRIAECFDNADVSEVSRHDEFIDWSFDAGDRLRKALQAIDLTL